MNALGEAFRAALASLNAHRLRSFLTTLGILIGTMAVIAVVSVLQGFSDSIRDQFSDLGSNSLTLEALNDEENWRSGRINRLSFEDIDALRYKVPGVKDVAPIIVANLGAVTWRTRNVTPQILGTTEDAQSVLGTATRLGRFITASDDQGGRRVVVIGVDVRDKLKLPRDPVGEFVLIGREWFKVVGVLEKRGEIFGFSQDNRAFIPFSVARSLTGTFDEPYMEVSFTVDDIGQVAQVKERALRAVRTTRGIKAGMTDDFEVKAADSFLKQFNQITGTATAVLAGIVGISLLVGGIGIMNIMLVSVTERTREIGLRMAVGARGRDILTQFLVEAVTLSLIGGAIGILLGVGGATAIAELAGWRTELSGSSIVLAAGFAGAIGIFFGYYPAKKASRLLPIEALRYE